MSYTPGPWIDGNSPAPCGCAQEREYTHPRPRYSTRTYRQRILYCHLHAAAPELVETLTNLVNQFHPRDGSCLWWAAVGPSLADARAALARAKGE